MTEFEVSTTDAGVDVVRPGRRLNMVSAPHLSSRISELADTGRSKIVVDLSGTEFIDSSGLGALVSCLKRVRQAGGDLRLAAPTEQVRMVLDLTNLSRVLRPSETVEAAVSDLR
jgi:anti-sigma B factor antagonist